MSYEFETLLHNVSEEIKMDTNVGEISLKDFMKSKMDMREFQVKQGLVPEFFNSPMGIQLELTYRCNQKCVMCYNRSGEASSDKFSSELEISDWTSVAKSVSDLKPNTCVFSGGEPLLLGDNLFNIMDMISYSSMTKFIVISNGLLLDELKARKFANYKYAWFQISIDGATKETFKAVRGVDGWEKALEATLYLRKYKIPLVIATTIVKQNLSEVSRLVEQAFLLGADRLVIGPAMPSGTALNAEDEILLNHLEKEEFKKVIEKEKILYKNKMEILVSTDPLVSIISRAGSRQTSLIVRPNGDVKFDCVAPFILGNVKFKSLVDIWREKGVFAWKDSRVLSWVDACLQEGLEHAYPRPNMDPEILL